MKKDTIVTLGNKKDYYLADETVQSGIKYFLGTRVDENDNPIYESVIFKEAEYEDGTYLEPVEDPELIELLGAIFTVNYGKFVKENEE